MTSLSETALKISTPHLTHPKYRPDIDGLRAIAVLSVVAFHAFPVWMPGGFIGVDIFFVISGFLISTIIFGSLDKKSFSFTEFYSRRVNRIFPALIVVLVACFIFGWHTLYADEFKQLGKHIAGGAGFIANLLLWDEVGYFDTTSDIKPLLHLWSLGIEEQFYIFWPVFMCVAWRSRLNPLTIVLVIAAGSFALNISNIAANQSFAFYMPQTRVWELIGGAFVAYVAMYGGDTLQHVAQRADVLAGRIFYRPAPQPDGRSIKHLMSTVGVLLLAAGFLLIREEGFPGWSAVVPVAGAMLIISAGPGAWLNKHILSNRLMVWVGLISFPLYLWHWPLLSFARIIEGEMPAREIRMAAVGAAFVLAIATYLLIEKPLRRISSGGIKAAFLTLGMIGIGGAGYFAFLNNGIEARPLVQKTIEVGQQFNWAYTKNEICMSRYPFKDADSYGWWFCAANKDAPPTILLLGTSFANHLFPGLATNQKTKDNSVLSIGTCSPASHDVIEGPDQAITNPCALDNPLKQRTFIDGIIKDTGSVRYVIIDGLIQNPDAAYIDRINNRIESITSKGAKVIIFVPHVSANYSLKRCFVRPLKQIPMECTVPNSVREQMDSDFQPLIDGVVAKNENVIFYDQNEALCDKEKCNLLVSGMPIFRDEFSHFTEFASNMVIDHFVKWAEVNEPGILVQ
ncbi:acyltransferase family protein [Pseudomonas sp. Marseille-P9899]|uniref:acyltransferase family protein n=1 Tax=Pseudomonas sp. Marseille-P9899 TaxID=2730401 RepID=UPI00158A5B28|nr:acyltransferase family protein [Pseudomonas sp. Marseille-P9899]